MGRQDAPQAKDDVNVVQFSPRPLLQFVLSFPSPRSKESKVLTRGQCAPLGGSNRAGKTTGLGASRLAWVNHPYRESYSCPCVGPRETLGKL